jgi:CRP-like cAMP-binding protein
MFDALYRNITSKIDLTQAEFEQIIPFFIPKKLRKKQYFLQAGDVCRYTAFVSNGCMRSYTVDDGGKEFVMQFAAEEWWISDRGSFQNSTPSKFHIDALEDSELLLLSRSSMAELQDASPAFRRFMTVLLENRAIANEERVSGMLSQSAEQRYASFVEKYPSLVQRVPQHMIASFIGITPETLSRLRKQTVGNK